jgi:predicted permease
MSLLRRLWFLLRRGRLDRELREEMRWHLQQRIDALVAEGLSEAAAQDEARRAFGNLTQMREQSRDFWGFVWLDLLGQDLRHAARALVRNPLLTLIAVVSLGCAMAACCAVFALAHTTLFRALPVPEPNRLVVLRWVFGASGEQAPYESLDGWSSGDEHESHSTSFSYDAFLAARSRLRGRADIFGVADLYHVNLSAYGQSEIATGQAVSGNYFDALGIRPVVGRFFGAADDRADAPTAVAVISHALWLRRFGGRADVVGATVHINQVPAVVVGVAPPGFNGTRQVGETSDVTVPIALHDRFVREAGAGPGQTAEESLSYRDPRYWWVIMMARLGPGVDARSVLPELGQVIRRTVVAAKPETARHMFRVELEPGARGMSEMRQELVPTVLVMAVIVLLVVVIACANLATLLLARGVARDREVGVRYALGASRGRLLGALMLESLIIGVLGGAAGLVAARWLAYGLLPALNLDAAAIDITTSGAVLAFAFVAALVASLLFGLVPAWRGTDLRSMRAMKDGSGSVATQVPRLRTARAILTFQVAMSVVVLVAAGLLVRTIQNLERVKPGFDATNVLLFRVDPTLNHYDAARIRHLYSEILARVRALPGVEAASFSHHALVSRSSSISTVNVVDGATLHRALQANRLIVDPAFFGTMRIPLLAGATFTGLAHPPLVRPVVINQTFALRAFHARAPLGRRFRFGERATAPTYEVVGVAGDVPIVGLRRPIPPTVYFSYLDEETREANFAVRSAASPISLGPSVRRAVSAVDPEVPIDRMLTQEDQIASGVERERLFATLATALGLLALFLACVGIYGVMAYAVSRRRTEIGIRLALGAAPDRIMAMVLGEAGRVLAAGVGLGLAAAFVASRYLESVLFGLAARDPLTQVGAVTVLVGVALAAALVPARRAARTDPLIALRNE